MSSSVRADPVRPRVVLAHDWRCGLRGGERVLDALARLIESRADLAALLVMFDDARPLTPAIDAIPRFVSGPGRWPGASGPLRRWMLPLYPRAVEDLSRRLAGLHARAPVDLVISTSSAAIKGLRPPEGVPHLCICFSPARYLWSRGEDYERGSPLKAAGLRLLGPSLRAWDRASAANVAAFVAISRHVQHEVRRCYDRDSILVYPPVRTDFFTPAPETKREDFWLVVSALEPYKRVDLAVRAAAAGGRRLLVAGEGSQAQAIRAMAGPRVRMLGRVSDERLRELYRTARLVLFPQVEDFGIVALEAQACGCPVVARGLGGAVETVLDGTTGAWYDVPAGATIEQEVGALRAAAERCPADPSACRANAERFAPPVFEREMTRVIDDALGARRQGGPSPT